MFGSVMTTVSTWYSMFLIGRFMLGLATGALFYAAFALCKYWTYYIKFRQNLIAACCSNWKHWHQAQVLDVYNDNWIISSRNVAFGIICKLSTLLAVPPIIVNRSGCIAVIYCLVRFVRKSSFVENIFS